MEFAIWNRPDKGEPSLYENGHDAALVINPYSRNVAFFPDFENNCDHWEEEGCLVARVNSLLPDSFLNDFLEEEKGVFREIYRNYREDEGWKDQDRAAMNLLEVELAFQANHKQELWVVPEDPKAWLYPYITLNENGGVWIATWDIPFSAPVEGVEEAPVKAKLFHDHLRFQLSTFVPEAAILEKILELLDSSYEQECNNWAENVAAILEQEGLYSEDTCKGWATLWMSQRTYREHPRKVAVEILRIISQNPEDIFDDTEREFFTNVNIEPKWWDMGGSKRFRILAPLPSSFTVERPWYSDGSLIEVEDTALNTKEKAFGSDDFETVQYLPSCIQTIEDLQQILNFADLWYKNGFKNGERKTRVEFKKVLKVVADV